MAGRLRGEALREALIDATETSIARSGLAGTSLRAVVSGVGCGLGTVGHLFGSMDQLVLLANARTLRALGDHVSRAIQRAEAAALPDRLAAAASAYLRYARDNRNRWSALFEHRMSAGEEVPAWYVDMRDGFLRSLDTAIATPSGRSTEIGRTIFEAVHGVVALGLDRKLGGEEAGVSQRLTLLVRLLAAGVAASRPG